MARGVTLGELTDRLRIEAYLDPNPSLSVNVLELMKQSIRTEQERLYDEFDWPFLKITSDKAMEAGSRYYDVPTDMNLERIQKVDVLYGGRWLPVQRGISLDDYNITNSDDDVRTDPIRKWDVRDTGDGEQIEVWPMPASDGSTLRFTGIRKLNALVANADIADLDDQMIVLFVAAEMLAEKNQKAASLKLQRAKDRKATLQGRVAKTRTNTLNMNGRGPDEQRQPRVMVAVVRQS